MRRAALLVALTALAGCGSSGPHLSQAAYIRQGNAICSHYETAIHGLSQPAKITDLGRFITQALPILQRTVTRLGRLRPPSERADAFGKFLAAARATVTRAKALRDAAAKADGPAVQSALHQATRASGPRAGLARAAGLAACALD